MAPALAAVAAGLVLAALDGGYAPAIWYLAALFLLGLLALTVALAPTARHDRLFETAVVAYGAFCLWTFLSIAWARDAGAAWDGANRTLLYGIVLALVGLMPWSRSPARVALALVALGTAAMAAGVLVVSALVDQPARLFLEGRLAAPTGYANATAALWLIGFWPALELASGPDRGGGVRAVGLAAATLLLEVAVLSQSRGAAIAFVATALLFLGATPRRGPALLALAFVCSSAAVAWEPLLATHEATSPAEIASALAGAREAIGAAVLVALLAGAAAPAAGRRLVGAVPWRPALPNGRQGLPVLLAALAAATFVFGSPSSWVGARWHEFKHAGYGEVGTAGSRFSGSLGSNRYDFYRVSVEEFRAHPLTGIGADNFSSPYLVKRRSDEAPRYPHSLAMRVISQLGAVGAFLFLLFLGLVLACVARTIRRAPPAQAALAAAAAAGFTFWIAHGMVDWLWEFPGLGVTAFALLAVSARVTSSRESSAHLGSRGRGAKRTTAIALATALAASSLALPGAAALLQRDASKRARDDAHGALARLELAADLNPLSGEALTARGVIARRLGMTWIAREALERALEREPASWYVQLQLGLLELRSGRRAPARRRVQAALALNPRQPVLRALLRALPRRHVDERAVERALYEQRRLRLRPVRDPGGGSDFRSVVSEMR